MSPPIDIDGSEIQEATIDGQTVSEITIDGQEAFDPIPDSVIEDFERDNPLSDYSGGGNFSIIQSPVYEGADAAEGTSSATNEYISSTSVGTVEQGDVLACRVRLDGPVLAGVQFGVQTAGNLTTYQFTIDDRSDNNTLNIVRWDNNGTFNKLSSSSQGSIPRQEWLRAQVDWDTDGSILCECYDANDNLIDSVSTSDSDYTSGGIGFLVNDDTAQFDHFTIRKSA